MYSFKINWEGFIPNHGGAGGLIHLNLPNNTYGTYGFPGITWEHGINDSNIYVIGSGGRGQPYVVDNTTIDGTIAPILYVTGCGYDLYNPNYPYYELKQTLMPSKSIIENLDMTKIGFIIKVSGINQPISTASIFHIKINASDRLDYGNFPVTPYTCLMQINTSGTTTYIRLYESEYITLFEVDGVSTSLDNINGSTRFIIIPSYNTYRMGGMFIHGFHRLDQINLKIYFNLDIYRTDIDTGNLVKYIRIEGNKSVNESEIVYDKPYYYGIYDVPFRFGMERPNEKCYDGYCITNKYISDSVEFLPYFSSGLTFSNNVFPNGILLASQFTICNDPNYYTINSSYLSSINLNTFSTIFKLEGGPFNSWINFYFGLQQDPLIESYPDIMLEILFRRENGITSLLHGALYNITHFFDSNITMDTYAESNGIAANGIDVLGNGIFYKLI